MKLSICIPTYNRVSYLKRCLSSILITSKYDLEVIVQDNASTDSTEKFMKSINDARVKYYRNTSNIGMDANIITILKHASGEYVMYLTDDDFLFPDAIEKIELFLDKYKPSFFTTDIMVNLEKSRDSYSYKFFECTKNIYTPSDIAELYLSTNVLSRCGFNKKLFTDEDYIYFEKNATGKWYPHQLLLPIMLSKGDLGYFAEPIGIHTWENETFWGISPTDREILNKAHAELLIVVKDLVSYSIFKEIVCKIFLRYKFLNNAVLDLLNPLDKIHLEKELEKITSVKKNDELFKCWIESLQLNKSILSKIIDKGNNKVGIFGTGVISKLLSNEINNLNGAVKFYVETQKTENSLNGTNIYSLLEFTNQNLDLEIDILLVSIEGEHDEKIIEDINKQINNKKLLIYSWKDIVI